MKSGMVRRVHLGEDHYHYEHVSGNSHHDHLICTTCGGVIEFHDEVLEQRQLEICEKKKFTPTFHNLQILGVCDSCKRKGETPDSPDRVQDDSGQAHALQEIDTQCSRPSSSSFAKDSKSFLTVAIIFAYLRKTGRDWLRPAVWWGIGAAVVASFGLGCLLQRVNQPLWEGVLGLVAAVLVASFVIHVWRIAPTMKREMEAKIEAHASNASRSWPGSACSSSRC